MESKASSGSCCKDCVYWHEFSMLRGIGECTHPEETEDGAMVITRHDVVCEHFTRKED